MGTFATLFRQAEPGIPDEKKKEFRNRVVKLFQAGGMMEPEYIQLCGKEVTVLQKASMHDYGMDFNYNYFEDDYWENAGFSLERDNVWSDKIGWMEFHRVMVAAYTLESLYLDGPAIVIVNNELVASPVFTGWINYLFHEDYLQKNSDPWMIFEALHGQMKTDLNRYNWRRFAQDEYGMIGYYEIRAVLEGTTVWDEEFNELACNGKKDGNDDVVNYYDFMNEVKKAVRRYHETSNLNETEQLASIMEVLYLCYENMSKKEQIGTRITDLYLEDICLYALLTDAPAYVIKVIAEIYGIDFWQLWEQIKDVAKRKYYMHTRENATKALCVSTMEFFNITSDDMILFWGDDRNIKFSQELQNWFADLKDQFEAILEEDVIIEKPLHWILDLMEYADENYYHIYTFSDFFGETMEHLGDKRYLAVWKIYDKMLHDPEMEEAGNVIFVPDGPEYENVGLCYLDTPPLRRLKKNWDMMRREERNNKARVTFRRYMALLENRKLRMEIFRF